MNVLYADPFDCYSDPCHLAWLLRDNRHLLDRLLSGQCEDFTYLSKLPIEMFEECEPVPITSTIIPVSTPNPSENPNHAESNVKTNVLIVTLASFITLLTFLETRV